MLASIIYNYGKFCDDFKSTLKLGAYVICTGGKGLSDFCKSSSTTVEGRDFYVKESMVYVCVV